jgi:hypothetical protein
MIRGRQKERERERWERKDKVRERTVWQVIPD